MHQARAGAADDEEWMRQALKIAREHISISMPNPSVGSILVKNGKEVASGASEPVGGRHAEIVALDAAGTKAQGATLYTTLEPCCHEGKRTPPCTKRIIASGIARVVIAAQDENPAVAGKGIAQLRAANIDVHCGVLEDEAKEIYRGFFHWIRTDMPLVTVHMAMTLDGKMTWGDGKNKQVTGEESRKYVHELRATHDAILVGIGTVLADDPQLTVRDVVGTNPVRIVLDPLLETPLSARILHVPGKVILIAGNDAPKEHIEALSAHAKILTVAKKNETLDLHATLKALGEQGITSILVEGGVRVAQSFLQEHLAHRVAIFIAPFSAGEGKGVFDSGDTRLRLKEPRTRTLGTDTLIEGDVE